jgi:hypothetical protein
VRVLARWPESAVIARWAVEQRKNVPGHGPHFYKSRSSFRHSERVHSFSTACGKAARFER